MTEIIPDTSLYDGLPNKLRAFAAIMESGEPLQVMAYPDREWVHPVPVSAETTRLISLAERTKDFRAKPKPRELWVILKPDGKYWNGGSGSAIPHVYLERPEVADDYTAARFVEQP